MYLINEEFLKARDGYALMRINGSNTITARSLLTDVVQSDPNGPTLRDPFSTPGGFCILYSQGGNLRVIHIGERADDIRLDEHNNILLIWVPVEIGKLNPLFLSVFTTDIMTATQWIDHQNALLRQIMPNWAPDNKAKVVELDILPGNTSPPVDFDSGEG